MTCARHRCNANTFLRLHIALFTPHTPHFTLALHLNSSHRSSSHLIPCLPRCQLSSSWLFSCQVLSSNDVYYKSFQKLVPSTNLYYCYYYCCYYYYDGYGYYYYDGYGYFYYCY